MRLHIYALVLLLLAPGTSAFAQSERVTGRVLDAIQAQPLPGATVEVVGTDARAVTDLDGRYALTLAPGSHQIRITMPGFAERLVDITVAVDTTPPPVDVMLPLQSFSEELLVTADAVDAETSSASAQLRERRAAMVITDNLGSQEMRDNADSNAASALQRVTGLSSVDNFIFVRGLGERYSNTTLNGTSLPSTEPERKVVGLDMFPAGLLDSVQVVKSFSPDRSAEFAGGMVEIVPSRLAARPLLNFSYKFGGNSQAWGQDILDHTAGSSDWLGLANNDRDLPAGFPTRRIARGGIFTPELGFTQDRLEQLGESLVNDWSPRSRRGKPSQGFSASFGGRWGAFGLSGGVNQSYGQSYREETFNTYSTGASGALTPFSTYDYRVGETSANLSTLINAGWALNDMNQVGVQTFTTDKGTRETRTFEGYNDDASRDLRNSRLLWREENLRSVQISGDHAFLTASNSRIDWRASFARSNRDEPDIREVLYEDIGGTFLLADESQSGLRMFNDLDEDTQEVALNWTIAFGGPRGLPAQLKVGPSYQKRQRDFSSRRFRFVPMDTRGVDLSVGPDQLYAAQNVGTIFEFREETRTTDTYTAEQSVGAFYAMVDMPVSIRSRLVAGARVESFRQTVDTYDLFDVDLDENQDVIRAEIEETDFFPSVNFVQDLGNNQNLRLSYSQTVNRPEFRELAPFEFTDIVGGRAVVGNPDLERSLIQNVDVRWEWFPGARELMAASVFYKHFDQPIERFVEPTAQRRTSYLNADSARNLGFELEVRKALGGPFFGNVNYTFVDSSITIPDFLTNVVTSLERPLSGTSKHLFNAQIEGQWTAFNARLLYNFVGDRIADIGVDELPDVIEEGRSTLDFAASARLNERFNVRFSVDDLTNSEVRFLQASQEQLVYTPGRTISISLGFVGF